MIFDIKILQLEESREQLVHICSIWGNNFTVVTTQIQEMASKDKQTGLLS